MKSFIRKVVNSSVKLQNNLLNHSKVFKFCSKNEKTGDTDKENFKYSDIIKYFFENNVKLKKLPCFEVYSSQIEILNLPMDFYLAILKLIRSAKQRICISSLYLGTGKMEAFLVEELLKALRKNPDLKITILLDYSRGTRLENGKTSLTMNIKLAFLVNPRIGPMHNHLPGIISEVSGVLHSKLIVSDNHTILTGANLSHNYFTNRQDRYYIIQDCEPFADYCEDYINALSNVAFLSDSTGELYLPNYTPNPFKDKVDYINTILQQFKMFKFDNRVKIPSGSDLKMEDYFENLEKHNNNYRYRPEYQNFIEFNKENKKEFLKMLINENKDKNLDFLKIEEKTNDIHKEANLVKHDLKKNNLMHKPPINHRVLIFPSFQFFNIKQTDEQDILKGLLSCDYFSKIRLSSGYLNLSDFIIEIFQKSHSEIEVVTSSPKANSFYKAGFIKKNIPYFYRRYEQLLLQKMKSHNKFSLFEFQRENWSFHSKGMWLFEKGKETPSLTIIGSSNFNYRAYERDIENQFYIFSFCENFSQRLQLEADDNFSDCRKISLQDINKDKDIKIKLRHKIMAKILKRFL